MQTYSPFSIVSAPFPFTDSSKSKNRPVLTLSSEAHQMQTNHIAVLMITSAKHSAWPSDFRIKHLETTGLSAESIVRQKLFTIDLRLIKRKMGNLAPQDKEAISAILLNHLEAINMKNFIS